jgi:uncharacterized protein YkwD
VSLRALRRALTTVLATAVLTGGAGAVTVAVAPTAFASSYTFESEFIAKMNAARQSAGLAPYAVASDLTSVARSHSAHMASSGSLYHNPSLTSDVSNWQAVGENVGEGPNVDDIHTAFMNSPEHRANILDHDFTQVGVGVSVDKNGIIWVTEDFRQPMSSGGSASSGSSSSSSSHSSSPSTTPSSSSGSSSYTPTSTPGAATVPQPTLSPRAQLKQRLQQLKHDQRGDRRPSDPVAQAFDYVDALSRLAA